MQAVSFTFNQFLIIIYLYKKKILPTPSDLFLSPVLVRLCSTKLLETNQASFLHLRSQVMVFVLLLIQLFLEGQNLILVTPEVVCSLAQSWNITVISPANLN